MCELSYIEQVERLERMALAQMALAPHVEDPGSIPTAAGVIEEFSQWLVAEPAASRLSPEDQELFDLVGVRG